MEAYGHTAMDYLAKTGEPDTALVDLHMHFNKPSLAEITAELLHLETDSPTRSIIQQPLAWCLAGSATERAGKGRVVLITHLCRDCGNRRPRSQQRTRDTQPPVRKIIQRRGANRLAKVMCKSRPRHRRNTGQRRQRPGLLRMLVNRTDRS